MKPLQPYLKINDTTGSWGDLLEPLGLLRMASCQPQQNHWSLGDRVRDAHFRCTAGTMSKWDKRRVEK